MKLGIVGISGLVGENILISLDMLNIEYDELYLFGNSTAGKKIIYKDKEYMIHKFDYKFMNELNFIILAVDNDIAKNIIEYHRENKCSCVIIDNSSEYRLDSYVPLIVPEINGNILDSDNSKIIANPNCSTTMLVMILKPLMNLANISKVIVSTYQAASGAGKAGYDELIHQTFDYTMDGGEITTTDYWKKQYLFNIFSHNSKISLDNKYNQEEIKMIKESCKILDCNIKINPTCIRVPTLRSHCLSINIQFDKELSKEDIFNELSKFDGIKIINDEENNSFPEPVFTSGKPDIYVGRIRPEFTINGNDNSNWSFFVSGDQLLKGAAYNSVQILKKMNKTKSNISSSKKHL